MTHPNPERPEHSTPRPEATHWAAPPQPQAPPMPIPSPNGKPYFRSGGWFEVLSITAMVIGALMIAFGLIALFNGTPGSGMATALGLVVVVLGGILAAVLRLGSMLESTITQRR
ncbi:MULTISPECIES: hypothetical protein [Actinomycetes]|uniref:hypothetical protein n=1 Tax=Actinomycetes TaxID=1760 RepID=UPI00114D0640|nr:MULTISPECIES: hypothetical protein [Actinomycetes]